MQVGTNFQELKSKIHQLSNENGGEKIAIPYDFLQKNTRYVSIHWEREAETIEAGEVAKRGTGL
jgi:hypothetical protein